MKRQQTSGSPEGIKNNCNRVVVLDAVNLEPCERWNAGPLVFQQKPLLSSFKEGNCVLFVTVGKT